GKCLATTQASAFWAILSGLRLAACSPAFSDFRPSFSLRAACLSYLDSLCSGHGTNTNTLGNKHIRSVRSDALDQNGQRIVENQLLIIKKQVPIVEMARELAFLFSSILS